MEYNNKITIEVTNTYCKIVSNMSIDRLAFVQGICSFRVEGSDFTRNAFMKKHPHSSGNSMDGYKKLFNAQTRKFPIGLLSRVIEELGRYGITVDLVEKRQTVKGDLPEIIVKNIEMRGYQSRAVMQSVINGNGIVKAATGSGKTTIAAITIGALHTKTIFIVHTRDLLYQTKESFEQKFDMKIGQIGDGIIDYQDITVATMQTLARLGSIEIESYKYDEDKSGDNEAEIELTKQRFEEFRKYRNSVGCVMMDEVQIVCSKTAFGVRFLFEMANYAFGYSASPWRDDGSDLMIEAAFGKRIIDISASELIIDRYLVQPMITVIPNKTNVYLGTTYDQIYKSAIVDNMYRNLKVVDRALMHYNMGRNTLILVTLLRHGEILKNMIQSMGIDAQFISGKSGMKKRKQAIQDMRDGKTQLLIASTIADVGLDIPRLQALVEAGAGKSSVTALQRLGRVMRPFPGKDYCYYDTFNDEVPMISQHIKRKIEIWRTEPMFAIFELREGDDNVSNDK